MMDILSKYRWLAALLGAVFVGYLIWYFHIIVFYILAAAAMSLVGRPLVHLVERVDFWGWRIPRWLSAFIVLLTLLAVLFGLAWMIIPVVVDKVQFFAQLSSSDLNDIMREPVMTLERWVKEQFPSSNFSFRQIIATRIEPIFNSGFVRSAITGITAFLADVAIATFSVSFICYFFLKDDKLFNEGVVTLFPKKYEANIIRAVNSSINLLMRYFVGICIESLIKLFVVTFSLYVLGMEFSTALLIGMITAVLNVIPYIGPLIGAIFAFAIAAMSPMMAGETFAGMMFEISIVLLIFQLLDNIILQPYIYSSSVKAHPLEIFLVILMAGYIAGVVGMLLAIPAYTVMRVFAKEFFNNLRVVQKLTEKL